jgi:uncharacterized protein
VEAAEGIAMDKAGGSNRLQFSRNPVHIAMHHAAVRGPPARSVRVCNASTSSNPVKLHLQGGVAQRVTGTGPGWIRVNADVYRDNVVLTPDAVHAGAAPGGFDALAEADFAALLAYDPEIVLFGSGDRQRFPNPRLGRALTDAHVGIEVMDTPAACRTFNILTGEGRRVVALLLLG